MATTLYGPDGTVVSVADSPASLKARLLARGYSLTPVVVPAAGIGARQLPGPAAPCGAVVFRWDDGYASALQLAQLASKNGQRHTFALTSDLIGQSNYLTSAGVTAIAKAGHEIACHAKTHVSMTGLTAANRVPQYDDSRTALLAIDGVKQVSTFVYPLGGTARDATTDSELWGRYERIMDTSGAANRRWMYPADRRTGMFSVASFNLDGTTKAQEIAKSAIKVASRQPVIVSFYSHDLGAAGSVSLAQATELIELAASLQVPCITAAEAWPGGSLLRDGGFEAADLYNWEIVPTTTQTAAIATDAPVTGLPGTKSLKLTNAVAAETVYVEQEVPVVGGLSYTLSGRLRLSVAGDASNHIRYRISQRDRSGAAVGSISNGATVTATSWTAGTPLTVVLDPTTAFVKISVLLTGVIGDGYADHLHFGPTAEGSFG